MPQVTEAEVRNLLGTTSDTDIAEHIKAAAIIVEEDLASSGLSAQRSKLIEMFLAAHFVTLAIERGGLTQEVIGEAEEHYVEISGEGYNATRWGQQAMSLDTTGTLADLSNPSPRAEFEVVGSASPTEAS